MAREVAMSKRKAFEGRADAMLESFAIFKDSPTVARHEEFNHKLRELMKTNMSDQTRDKLDTICEQSNFFMFHKQGLFQSISDLQNSLSKKCKRSNPPITFEK